MRISTGQIFDRSMGQMSALSVAADKAQNQISTGKKFARPSDDAIAHLRLSGLTRAEADQQVASSNAKMAQMILGQSDTSLGSIETQLQRAYELGVQAANGTYNANDRAAMAETIDSIIDQVYALANTRDARGQPVFGGATGDVAYARAGDGSIAFAGTGQPAAIPIGDGATVQASDSGARIFGGAGDPAVPDMFANLSALATALRSGGTGADIQAGIDGITASLTHVGTARASVGARMARVELEVTRLDDLALARAEMRSGIEDTDVAAAITELQKTLTVLQATQASFTRLTGMSLFDQLR